MSDRLMRLAERRATLIERAAQQRGALAEAAAPWRKHLSIVDRAIDGIRAVAQHPAFLAISTMMLVAIGPRTLIKWGHRGWVAWRLARDFGRKRES